MAAKSHCVQIPTKDGNDDFGLVHCIYPNEEKNKQSNSSKINTFANDMSSVDHLVLTAFLLLSVGISLVKSLSAHSDPSYGILRVRRKPSSQMSNGKTALKAVSTAGAIVSPFVNTLCLFSINGEILANDANILFIFVGIAVSIPVLSASGLYSIVRSTNITSVSTYLKKRYRARTAGLMVVICSILRTVIGGVLNLYIVGVVVSSVTKLSAPIVYILTAAASVICVSASRIHTRVSSSFGGIFIWLLGITIIISLCVVTVNTGGVSSLLSKAFYEEGKFSMPSVSLMPWDRTTSVFGYLSAGLMMGFQIYGLSRVTLRYVADLPQKALYSSIAVSLFYILLWLVLGTWCGLCTSVTFKLSSIQQDVSPRSIDGSLAQLMSLEMEDHRGFRGFFIAALLAASISGLTRRFNQLIGLIYITFKDLKDIIFAPSEGRTLPKHVIEQSARDIPEDVLKHLEWEEQQRTCVPIFTFKFLISLFFGILSVWMVWVLHTSHERIWELWVTVIGILNGAVMAALIIGLICPCISHASVIAGLVTGWVLPCCLAIGNRVLIRPGLLDFQDASFFEAVWKRDFPDTEESNPELFLHNENTGNNTEELSYVSKVFSISYCYYGVIGFVGCFVTASIFAAFVRQCCLSPSVPRDLIHPSCAKTLRSSNDDSSQDLPAAAPSVKSKRTKHRAMSLVQETAGV